MLAKITAGGGPAACVRLPPMNAVVGSLTVNVAGDVAGGVRRRRSPRGPRWPAGGNGGPFLVAATVTVWFGSQLEPVTVHDRAGAATDHVGA